MKKYFLKDTSLNNIDEDQFRYQDFSNNLRKIIEYNESPFNIAIVGKWGLGKSSLVNMALAPLKNKDKEYLICEINAWKYEKDEIGKAFLKELWEGIQGKKILSFNFFHKDYNDIVKKMFEREEGTLKKNEGLLRFLLYLGATILGSVAAFAVYCILSNKFYGINFNGNTFWLSTFLRYCKNIGSILVIPLVVWLGKLFMDKINAPTYKNYEISFPLETQADYEIYLKSLLQEYYKKNSSKKIVVVIDDLDRLSADKIVEALDALKLFMEYDRFIFIVPFDDEILKNALKEKRIKGISTFDSEYDGEMVLDKIFQFKIYLPQLIKYDMRNYAFEISKKDCADFIREYCNNNYKLFEEIVGKILIHNDVATPRQVKKIINTFVENVMISRDREQANKVGEGFVTEKTGLQTIAKISVLQSDYNEFYDLLFKDVNVINEMLMIHRSNGELEVPELLRNYYDANNILKRKYAPLVNFLIFTEYLGHKNITPYLYMAQTEAGVLVGDKKQQDFMAAIESCNLVTVRQLLKEAAILNSVFVENLKYSESLMIGNIILSAIDCYDILPENSKEEIAVAIVERIPSLSNSTDDFRYDLLNEKNLIEICHTANSQEHNSMVEYILSNSQQNSNDKNKVGLINKIAKIKNELSDLTLGKFESYTREWFVSKESEIQDICKFVQNEGIEYIAGTFGKEYIQKISKYITENDDFENSLIKQFGNIISEFLKNNSILTILDALMPCYDYPVLYAMLDEAVEKNKYKDIDNAKGIAKKIVSVGVNKLKGIYGYNILSKISYTIEEDDGEMFDDFFIDTIGEVQFEEMIESFAFNNSLEILPNTVKRLSEYSVEENGYAPDIRKLLKLFTEDQSKEFWKKIDDLCKYASTKDYEILSTLVLELSKDAIYDEKMTHIIESNIIPGVGNYYSNNKYLVFGIQTVSAYKNRIQQSSVDQYCVALMKAISTNTENVINAYRVIHRFCSNNVWCQNVDVLLSYVSESEYAVIFDIITSRINLFSEENGNLKKLVEFLVDYIDYSDNPNRVINVLNVHFKRIGNLSELIGKMMDIEYDESDASIKLAKFIDSSSVDTIVEIIQNEWKGDETHKNKLTKILSESGKYSIEDLVCRINENKQAMNKNDILSMLAFCEETVTENNIKSVIDIMSFLLEEHLEKDVCSQILLLISSFSVKVISKERDSICAILVEIFKKSSSEENRRKCSILIKDKGFARKMRSMLTEKELNEYKAYLA